ncbi:MAG: hypothetical protein GY861_18540 [bacterium]|nr:hypothetical protein [bacterium]
MKCTSCNAEMDQELLDNRPGLDDEHTVTAWVCTVCDNIQNVCVYDKDSDE